MYDMFKELLVSEDRIIQDLVGKAKKLIGIDEKSGRAIILADRELLRDIDAVYCVILARYIANKLGLTPAEVITTDEVAEQTGIKKKVASARLSDLKREGLIESVAPATWRVVFAKANTQLGKILARLEKKHERRKS